MKMLWALVGEGGGGGKVGSRRGQYQGDYNTTHAYPILLSAFEKFNIKNTYK